MPDFSGWSRKAKLVPTATSVPCPRAPALPTSTFRKNRACGARSGRGRSGDTPSPNPDGNGFCGTRHSAARHRVPPGTFGSPHTEKPKLVRRAESHEAACDQDHDTLLSSIRTMPTGARPGIRSCGNAERRCPRLGQRRIASPPDRLSRSSGAQDSGQCEQERSSCHRREQQTPLGCRRVFAVRGEISLEDQQVILLAAARLLGRRRSGVSR